MAFSAETLTITPAWPFDGLQMMHYGVILADPPWHFRTFSAKGEAKSPQAQYATMSIADIQALPVSQLAAPDAVCIMWATAPMLPQAIATMAAWGFRYSSAGAWGKLSKTGAGPAFGTGYDYRSAAEFWLLGKLGNPKPLVRNVRNLVIAPVREHSRKPDSHRAEVERHWPGPRCELFAREPRPGWDGWGNEVNKFQEGLAA